MTEKRINNTDRRQGPTSSADLPLVDDHGVLVELERRIAPDRRLENICVEEVNRREFIRLVIPAKKD